jgi:hypothetical protein
VNPPSPPVFLLGYPAFSVVRAYRLQPRDGYAKCLLGTTLEGRGTLHASVVFRAGKQQCESMTTETAGATAGSRSRNGVFILVSRGGQVLVPALVRKAVNPPVRKVTSGGLK